MPPGQISEMPYFLALLSKKQLTPAAYKNECIHGLQTFFQTGSKVAFSTAINKGVSLLEMKPANAADVTVSCLVFVRSLSLLILIVVMTR